jgi:hypothetical protein
MLEFCPAGPNGQFRIAPNGSPRQGSSPPFGIIRIRSKLLRIILLHLYGNKSFAVILLRKFWGAGGQYLTHNFKSLLAAKVTYSMSFSWETKLGVGRTFVAQVCRPQSHGRQT